MKNIISEINANLVKVASPCNSTGGLCDVHDGNLIGGGVGKLNGVTVGWWAWEKDGKHYVRAVIPTHTSVEYHTDAVGDVCVAVATALNDLRESFILPNVKEHAPLSAGASVDHGVDVESTQEHENRAADRGCVSRLVRLSYLDAIRAEFGGTLTQSAAAQPPSSIEGRSLGQ